MHFTFRQDGGTFSIVAFPKDEHGDTTKGIRLQGDKTPLELIENTASFGLEVQNVDLDRVALASCLLFLPFIGEKVSFSYPVSDAIERFLSAPNLEAYGKKPIKVVTKTTGAVSRVAEPITVASTSLALGGGFDAVAVKTLLPEVHTYHLVNVIIRNQVWHYPMYRFYSQQERWKVHGRPVCDDHVWTNAETLTNPRGVTTWATYTLPALLKAADWGINCIMSGTVFEGSFCSNGLFYRDFRPGGDADFIGTAFKDAGITIAPGATMLPEYVNVQEVITSGLGDGVSFCIMGPAGGPCGKCMKCYRKKMLYTMFRQEGGPIVEQFENMSLAAFDTPYMRRSASADPIYLASTFRWLRSHMPEGSLLPFVEDAVRHLPPVRFHLGRVFPTGLEILPDVLRAEMGKRVGRKYQTMTDQEVQAVRDWNAYEHPRPAPRKPKAHAQNFRLGWWQRKK